jgi:type 1 glutamine amidotransferase
VRGVPPSHCRIAFATRVVLSGAMNLFRTLLPLGLGLLGLAATSAGAAPLRVLYFTKSAGYEHSVIKRAAGETSYSEKVLTALAAAHDLEFTYSKDGSLFSPEYLAKFDVIMFYTTGDLTSVGNDGQPAMTAAGKQALLDAVAGGKGFVGLHCASDTFHTGEIGGGNPAERGSRYRNYGEKADPYIRMLGGEFIVHDEQQVAKARVVDPAFPGCAGLGEAIDVKEEWYTLKEFASDDHVLLLMDTTGMTGPDYQRPSYPLAWARTHGKGRVWFNAMGHREDVWDNPKFQGMLIGGIEWAGGRAHADIPANLKLVAPGANTLQPLPPEKK